MWSYRVRVEYFDWQNTSDKHEHLKTYNLGLQHTRSRSFNGRIIECRLNVLCVLDTVAYIVVRMLVFDFA